MTQKVVGFSLNEVQLVGLLSVFSRALTHPESVAEELLAPGVGLVHHGEDPLGEAHVVAGPRLSRRVLQAIPGGTLAHI